MLLCLCYVMLCYDSPIGITRLASGPSTSLYYFNTNGFNNTRYVDDDELSEECDIDTTYQFCGNKYLSAEDLKKDHDFNYLLNNIEDKILN